MRRKANSKIDFGFSPFSGSASLRTVNKQPISVSIISGADVDRIKNALESVSGWTSQIIVVLNDDVRDGTEEVAKRFGAEVFREAWRGVIAQKNSAAEKATQEWVLNLDSDEAVSPELRDEIMTALGETGQSPQPVAFNFPRLNKYCGRWIRHGDWYPDRRTRLWRRGRGHFEGEDPHDHLVVEGQTRKLRGNLLHYPMKSINHQIAKTVEYADFFVKNRSPGDRRVTMADLAIRPAWRFLRAYIFKLGFLDGWQGFSIAWLTSFYTFLRYARVRESELPKETGK